MSDGMGAEPISIFTLWPEWRDYDPTIALIQGVKAFHHIFTLWPEWRDYDTKPPPYVLYPTMYFYLVTWMKGLRHQDRHPSLAHQRIFTLWPEWRDYDLQRRAVFALQTWICFYLVTWMKGLRLAHYTGVGGLSATGFYLVTWMKGLRHKYNVSQLVLLKRYVFTLWPEWRDYDSLKRYIVYHTIYT